MPDSYPPDAVVMNWSPSRYAIETRVRQTVGDAVMDGSYKDLAGVALASHVLYATVDATLKALVNDCTIEVVAVTLLSLETGNRENAATAWRHPSGREGELDWRNKWRSRARAVLQSLAEEV